MPKTGKRKSKASKASKANKNKSNNVSRKLSRANVVPQLARRVNLIVTRIATPYPQGCKTLRIPK